MGGQRTGSAASGSQGGEIRAQAMVFSALLGASTWHETLAGVGSASFLFSFFLIRSNQSESEEPSFLLDCV